jgi:ABC-2 type transport system ATP-binding protein
MTEIIAVRRLSKRYNPPDGPLAVDDADFQIQAGEVFSLLGPNGAGKTTLISMLCGLFPPSSGDAIVAGHSVVQEPMAVKQIIGVVPEEVALYPQLTAYQNLRYFGLLYGLGGQELENAIDDVLTTVELGERAGEKVARYSSGMKRRLNLGLGLLHKPRILLMDEPTLGLDPNNRRRTLDLVLQLRRNLGVTILYTTHYIEEAETLSDRVGIMHRGQIIALGTPDELVQAIHGQDIMRLQLDTAQVPATILSALAEVEGVNRVSLEKKALVVSLQRAARSMPEILRVVSESGLGVSSLTVQPPTLESVFLHLTGQRLVDAV